MELLTSKDIIKLDEEILIYYMRRNLYEKNKKLKKHYTSLIKDICDILEDLYNQEKNN